MEILVLITYFLFGILLFVILNFLNKKYQITLTDYVIFSLIYLIIISSIYSVNNSIFLVIIFEFVVNIIHTTYIKEENFFQYKHKLYMYIILIVLAFILNQKFINTKAVILSNNDFRMVIWVLIGIFIYSFFKEHDIKYSSLKVNDNYSNITNKQYIVMMFAKMKNSYKNIINCDKDLIYIIYAGMIYFNHERPYYLRKVDSFKTKMDNKKRKLGIMQIESNKLIDDSQSIDIACININKLKKKMKQKKIKKEEFNSKIISEFYKGNDINKINNIYNIIVEFNKD